MTEQQVIHHLQDDMVERAERLVRELSLRKGEGAKSGKNQASRALEVAQSAGSLSVFINWLRYQAGRERIGDFWTKSIETKRANRQERYLAKEMSDELVWLRKQILTLLAGDDKVKQDRVTMRATTRFLGYFRRALIGADYLDDIVIN